MNAALVHGTVLQVEFRNVYGNNRLYPVNELAKQFAKLLDVKTFSPEQVRNIKALGFTVGQVTAEIKL